MLPFLCRSPVEKTSPSVKSQEDDEKELEEKINKLQEMFPQLERTELLEVRSDGGRSQVLQLLTGDEAVPTKWLLEIAHKYVTISA